METLLYAVFDTQAEATAAVDRLRHRAPPSVVSVILHEGHLSVEDLPTPGTRSLRLSVFGAIASGLGAAALCGLLMAGLAGPSVSWTAAVAIAGCYGAILGGLGAAIGGSTDPKPIAELLAKAVERGAHLVLVEVRDRSAAETAVAQLQDAGARYVGRV